MPQSESLAYILDRLILAANELSNFENCTFCSPNNLRELDLTGNGFSSLETGVFDGLSSVKVLKLERNAMKEIKGSAFRHLHSLENLYLGCNELDSINVNVFRYLPSLRSLFLEENRIGHISDGAFTYQQQLRTLGLANNQLKTVRLRTFGNLRNLKNLNLWRNRISTIEAGAFNDTISLTSLSLESNHINSLPNGLFNACQNLTHIYFDKFQLCLYARHVRVCMPKGDGISSHKHLLANVFLRVTVWIVAILSCLGNSVVLLGRFLLHENNKTHSLFIKNLAFADFLMGLYLFIIASYDVKYRQNYLYHEREWRLSWQCDVSGVISTLSCEVSVLILTVITLDRYVCVTHPFISNKRSLGLAYVIAAIIWLLSILLAVIPVVKIPYFGESYYNTNGACLPLHIHEPFGRGWEYSAFVFIGINSLAFVFIVYAYAMMFYLIKKSNISIRSTSVNHEASIARRFSFIIFSDATCWTPIIIIKILALSGLHIDKNLHAWVAVFILPVNSALNPIIYTLTTKLFKEHLIRRIYYICRRLLYSESSSSWTGSAVQTRQAMEQIHFVPGRNNQNLRQIDEIPMGSLFLTLKQSS
ncbi:relaxin receptor 2-like [Tubulanus polymorphus]|uniref:relaxin receptor 2-like n=1 Tax=Tubulanus polymorphus TaxID=672921 RepID=UPI003DA3CFF4